VMINLVLVFWVSNCIITMLLWIYRGL